MGNKEQTKDFKSDHKLPKNWEIEQLGKIILNSFSGGTPSRNKKEFFENGTIPWIKSGEINQIYVNNTEELITELALKNSSAKITPKGTLLYALYGATAGVVGFTNIEAALNQAILAIFPNPKKLQKEYLFYHLGFQKGKILKKFTQGGQPNLSASLVKGLVIPLPPLPEQRAIAQVLGTMDSVIRHHTQLIAQKELRKKWLMQHLLTGSKRLKGFEGGWKTYRIGELFEKIYRYADWSDESLYRLVSIRRRFGGLFDRGASYGRDIGVKKIKQIAYKDFLISKRQVSHGAWTTVKPEFDGGMVSNEYDCLTIKDESKVIIEFWDWFCKMPIMSHYAFLASNGVHIEKLIFDYNTFKKRKISIPASIEEQKAIAHILQTADTEIELLKAKTEKLREQKKGMMQVLLTGKKRLKLEE